MVELLQNLVELNAIFDRMLAPVAEEIAEVTSVAIDRYDPVDGITYL